MIFTNKTYEIVTLTNKHILNMDKICVYILNVKFYIIPEVEDTVLTYLNRTVIEAELT